MSRGQLIRKELSDLYAEIDLGTLMDKVIHKVRHYLDCEEAAIFLYDHRKRALYFESVTGGKQETLKKIVLKRGEGVAGWVAEHDQPLIINDCATDSRFTAGTDKQTDFNTRSLAAIPVRLNRKLLGVLEAVNKRDGGFTDDDREMLENISQFVAIPLQNALLFKKTIQEHRQKGRLLELAKSISYAGNREEVFAQLKDIICDIITPQAINVLVIAGEESRMYRLLENSGDTASGGMVQETMIGDNMAVFPLKARERRLGILELRVDEPVPEDVISLIRGLAAFVAILIEKLEMQARIIEKERLEKELQIARDIQQSFLPAADIRLEGLDIAYINIPSSEVGGDYYDIVPLDDRKIIFTVNDVAGHGIPASLLMSIFRTQFVYRVKKEKDMTAVIGSLNDMLAETTDANHYVTSFTCRLDRRSHTLSYVNAGHNPPVLLRGEKIIKLEAGGMPVGMFPGIPYQEAETAAAPGDLLVMYTDGIVEAENPAGEQYSLDRLLDFIKARRGQRADVIKEAVIDDLKNHTGRPAFEDDITFILVIL